MFPINAKLVQKGGFTMHSLVAAIMVEFLIGKGYFLLNCKTYIYI